MTRTYSSQLAEAVLDRDLFDHDLVEARRADERLDLLRLAERELARFAGLRRLLEPALDQDRAVGGRPGVALCRRPRREGERPASAEHSARLAQRAGRIRNEHVAEAARRRRRRSRPAGRSTACPSRDARHPRIPRRRAASTIAAERSVEITCATRPASASVTSPVPAARSSDDVGRLQSERREKRHGDRRVDGGDELALGLPAGCRGVPATPNLIRRLYAATPLNWGRMSRPYAASVSSWPWVIR